eukprot:gene4934-21274_t
MYYTMQQQPEIELVHAFALKLKPAISRDLMARDFRFPSLTALIEAAKRFETTMSESSESAAHVSFYADAARKQHDVPAVKFPPMYKTKGFCT